MKGFMGKDHVCLGTDSAGIDCVQNFDFFVVTAASGLEYFNGVLGMGPINVNNGPSFM